MSQAKNQSYDYMSKVIIVGDSAVGKTNMLLQYSSKQFKMSHLTTIGVDFKIKTIKVDGVTIKLQIWDTAGQDRFRTITETYFKGAEAAILVYSINDRNSFTGVENWLKQIENSSSENLVKILVGNKCDLQNSERQITISEGEALARKFGINFYECSAKENININEIFDQIGKQINEKVKNINSDLRTSDFQILRKKEKKSSVCGC